ncbi:hypothetical protein B0H17DRAFT_1189810 [Mycena rosella]|uniref:Uncharacterized protein n=1 Tax=Mycena rosella TaxID=1033263 RepID=A0AAD7F5Y0_MYCRO|nr:hypothetical protein B0H17DRAFT_1189810 [Mycena rosella]
MSSPSSRPQNILGVKTDEYATRHDAPRCLLKHFQVVAPLVTASADNPTGDGVRTVPRIHPYVNVCEEVMSVDQPNQFPTRCVDIDALAPIPASTAHVLTYPSTLHMHAPTVHPGKTNQLIAHQGAGIDSNAVSGTLENFLIRHGSTLTVSKMPRGHLAQRVPRHGRRIH